MYVGMWRGGGGDVVRREIRYNTGAVLGSRQSLLVDLPTVL